MCMHHSSSVIGHRGSLSAHSTQVHFQTPSNVWSSSLTADADRQLNCLTKHRGLKMHLSLKMPSVIGRMHL